MPVFTLTTAIFALALITTNAIWLFFLLNKKKQNPQRLEPSAQFKQTSQYHLQCVIDSLPPILVIINRESTVTHWNNAAQKTTGVSSDQALGKPVAEVYPDLPFSKSIIRDALARGIPYSRDNVQQGVGSQASFYNFSVLPLQSDDTLEGAIIMIDDISMRVRIENLMIQNEKIMSLGELAAGIAHEINNPLAGILSTTQNIQRRLSPELEANLQVASDTQLSMQSLNDYLTRREIYSFLDQIRETGERAAHIVTNLLEFSRGNNREYVPTPLDKLINHSLVLAANTFQLETHLGIELPQVNKTFDSNMPPVPCVATEIQQVILNLLKNAAQAFQSDEYGPPLQPEISIRTFREDDYAVIEISDNGPGISAQVRSHIFEPFFTTKDIGKGTGLGLSVSYFIITEHHNGEIEVESVAGQGSRFIIRLPLSQKLNPN